MSNFRIFAIGAVLAYCLVTAVSVINGAVNTDMVLPTMAFWGFWGVVMWGDRQCRP